MACKAYRGAGETASIRARRSRSCARPHLAAVTDERVVRRQRELEEDGADRPTDRRTPQRRRAAAGPGRGGGGSDIVRIAWTSAARGSRRTDRLPTTCLRTGRDCERG